MDKYAHVLFSCYNYIELEQHLKINQSLMYSQSLISFH